MFATYCCVSTVHCLVYCVCSISRYSTWSIWSIGAIWPHWIPARSGGSCDAHPVGDVNSCYTVHWCRQESLLSASCIPICSALHMYNTSYISPCFAYGRSGMSSSSIDLNKHINLRCLYREISFYYVHDNVLYLPECEKNFFLNHHLKMEEAGAGAL